MRWGPSAASEFAVITALVLILMYALFVYLYCNVLGSGDLQSAIAFLWEPFAITAGFIALLGVFIFKCCTPPKKDH